MSRARDTSTFRLKVSLQINRHPLNPNVSWPSFGNMQTKGFSTNVQRPKSTRLDSSMSWEVVIEALSSMLLISSAAKANSSSDDLPIGRRPSQNESWLSPSKWGISASDAKWNIIRRWCNSLFTSLFLAECMLDFLWPASLPLLRLLLRPHSHVRKKRHFFVNLKVWGRNDLYPSLLKHHAGNSHVLCSCTCLVVLPRYAEGNRTWEPTVCSQDIIIISPLVVCVISTWIHKMFVYVCVFAPHLIS